MSALPVIDPKAAAIAIGSEQMHVSIAGGEPKVFGSTTAQLHALRDYLLSQGASSVAMEATGVYWLCPYEVLEKAGLQVVMINGKYVKNLPGRKTDMKDCQWQATLHAHGLLRGGFVPQEHIRRLQDYQRLRADHIAEAASCEQHMQKALERMNIKLHDVISDLTGVSGLKVIRAILQGERNPVALLALCDCQIQKKKAERVCESLVGTWKEEHLFGLRQAVAAWEFYRGQIAECDQALEKVLKEVTEDKPAPPDNSLLGAGAVVLTVPRSRRCVKCSGSCVGAKIRQLFLASAITRCSSWWRRPAPTSLPIGRPTSNSRRGRDRLPVHGKVESAAAVRNAPVIGPGAFSA